MSTFNALGDIQQESFNLILWEGSGRPKKQLMGILSCSDNSSNLLFKMAKWSGICLVWVRGGLLDQPQALEGGEGPGDVKGHSGHQVHSVVVGQGWEVTSLIGDNSFSPGSHHHHSLLSLRSTGSSTTSPI